ncbi:hypothetical protein M069_5392 [Bacteroides fragilis str. B1 (UDC16-1)]|nr:hypothetical protein M069_5392 [Bacteroides fragilis str. B1 (UDC16-1)]
MITVISAGKLFHRFLVRQSVRTGKDKSDAVQERNWFYLSTGMAHRVV